MPASATSDPPRFSKRRKLAYSALISIALFGGTELLLRLTWTPPRQGLVVGARQFLAGLSELTLNNPLAGPIFRRGSNRLWELVPGASIAGTIQHRHPAGEAQAARITINEDGYRGRRIGSDAKAFRVLCLGDSNFFGYPLDDAHVFPAALEARLCSLHPDHKVEVINGGVPGYTIAQGRRLFEAKFAATRFDAVLLSFANNDAWRQPHTDAALFEQRQSALYGLIDTCQQTRIFQFLASFGGGLDPATFKPRVPLEDYLNHYREAITSLRSKGCRVVIIDHCAHPEYQHYSQRLAQLAQQRQVDYFAVAKRAAGQVKDPRALLRFAPLTDRVARRWGTAFLQQNPHLLLYAESHGPEHLNEVGVAWLAELIAPTLSKPR